jgi:hypothetical protein
LKSGGVSPEEFHQDIEASIQKYRENKYAFQVGLKDVEFEIDDERLETNGLPLPFKSIDLAEKALVIGAIKPTTFIEYDGTDHTIIAFDSRPVGYSGFLDCVTHSLVITDHGLFEFGRYPAISMSKPDRYWQWFLHRRLATPENLERWQDENSIDSRELIERIYVALTGVEG